MAKRGRTAWPEEEPIVADLGDDVVPMRAAQGAIYRGMNV
jgi:hypothetical protein